MKNDKAPPDAHRPNSASTPRASAASNTLIAEGIRLLHPYGGPVEARVVGTTRGTISGYFASPYELATAIAPWDGKFSIYVTLHRLKPELLARARNRLRTFAQITTSGDDVLARQWFPIDIDPVRARGIPARDEELTAALRRRNDLIQYLQEAGFPEPLRIMSGNGGWALYLADFPNTQEITELYKWALKALSQRFSDNVVKVDESIYQPAQLIKLPGTIAVKGNPIPGRPHRRARIQPPLPDHLFDEPRLVTGEQLQWLAEQARDQDQTSSEDRQGGKIGLIQLFKARGLYLRPLKDGKHTVICPWNKEHTT